MNGTGDLFNAAVNNLFNFPETLEKLIFPSRGHDHDSQQNKGVSSIPVDILDTPKEYVFFMDVPGLSKSEIQVLYSARKHHFLFICYRAYLDMELLEFICTVYMVYCII